MKNEPYSFISQGLLILQEIHKMLGKQNALLENFINNSQKSNTTSEFLSVRDTAKLIKKSPETVRRWIRSGKLEAIKFSDTKQDRLLVPKFAVYKMIENSQK